MLVYQRVARRFYPKLGILANTYGFFLEPRLRDIDKKMVNVSLKMSLLPSQL